MDIDALGADMTNEEIEEAVRYLLRARKQDDELTKAAAGQLRKVKNAKSLEDVKAILLIVAGQLEAMGKGR